MPASCMQLPSAYRCGRLRVRGRSSGAAWLAGKHGPRPPSSAPFSTPLLHILQASTVQILGAEKALFRALKTKHETPKYGLIYHASLIGQASPKNKVRADLGRVYTSVSGRGGIHETTDACMQWQQLSWTMTVAG